MVGKVEGAFDVVLGEVEGTLEVVGEVEGRLEVVGEAEGAFEVVREAEGTVEVVSKLEGAFDVTILSNYSPLSRSSTCTVFLLVISGYGTKILRIIHQLDELKRQ